MGETLPFGAAGVRRDDDAVLPLRDVFFDPLQDGGLGVQVIHGDVEKTLLEK